MRVALADAVRLCALATAHGYTKRGQYDCGFHCSQWPWTCISRYCDCSHSCDLDASGWMCSTCKNMCVGAGMSLRG